MSAPVKKCEVTPLEALQRLIGAASVIDANECKDEVAYNVLQSELAVAKEVAKVLAAAPEACPDPGACDRSGCCNPGGRCEEAAPVVPVAAQPVVPEGWKLVPEDPTAEMFDAACKFNNEMFAGGSPHGADDGQVWAAMYDAAPAAPSLEAQPAGKVIDQRARFEEWARRTHTRPGTHFDRSHNGVYKDNRIAAKWAAWSAAMTQGEKQ